MPHRRHWGTLLELTKQVRERAERERALEDQWGDVDFESDIQPGLEGVESAKIAAAIGVERKYAEKIRRGARVPPKRYWGRFKKLESKHSVHCEGRLLQLY